MTQSGDKIFFINFLHKEIFMKVYKQLLVLIGCLSVNPFLWAGTSAELKSVAAYNHNEYLDSLYQKSFDTWNYYKVSMDSCDHQVIDEAWVRVQWLIKENRLRDACDILEYLIVRAVNRPTTDTSFFTEETQQWYATLDEILPKAYGKFEKFDFDSFKRYLGLLFLFKFEVKDESVSNLFKIMDSLFSACRYNDICECLSILLDAINRGNVVADEALLKQCKDVFKRLFDVDYPRVEREKLDVNQLIGEFDMEDLENCLLQCISKVTGDKHASLLFAQEVAAMVIEQESEYYWAALDILTRLCVRQDEEQQRSIQVFLSDLLMTILAKNPGKISISRDDVLFIFYPSRAAEIIFGNMLEIGCKLNDVSCLDCMKKNFDVFLTRASGDKLFMKNNHEQIRTRYKQCAEQCLWGMFKNDEFLYDTINDLLASPERFDESVKDFNESFHSLRSMLFDENFVEQRWQEDLGKDTVVAAAIKIAKAAMYFGDNDYARTVLQRAYQFLLDEGFVASANILKEYVAVCPQSYEEGDVFGQEHDDFIAPSLYYGNKGLIFLHPDNFGFDAIEESARA